MLGLSLLDVAELTIKTALPPSLAKIGLTVVLLAKLVFHVALVDWIAPLASTQPRKVDPLGVATRVTSVPFDTVVVDPLVTALPFMVTLPAVLS